MLNQVQHDVVVGLHDWITMLITAGSNFLAVIALYILSIHSLMGYDMQQRFWSYFISACALLVASTAAGWSSMSSWQAFTSILIYLFMLGAIIGVGRGQADWWKLVVMTIIVISAVFVSFTLAKFAQKCEWLEFAQIGWVMVCCIGLLAYTIFIGIQNSIFVFLFILSSVALFDIPDLILNPKYSHSLSSASCLTYICWLGGLGAGLLGGYGRRIKERSEYEAGNTQAVH